ncbi:tRNA (uridine(34)/cytosine(34)/5-carboxymethylaminomethyluridine(34)-2'-O)-methyltransferase TrmL [Microaerobacter geothermalis]|uniref:tRNA (uridine(34)/cytosine(34)/5- carboxymethylaminomethyluridine(34)-2'-O)- methyltransferase TrmL n=1 Tax=Microaerobacter geothermalis TaxID=674972 RepID=UPI001F318A03|nr:tRNA (uridine(34)/cytosine(34)/5-carboxymethylaminomethyluridine(34)-2'-O)-methyltransferase TrmL [Microaerobacter geothermalis]MCF6094599.1 tRNA (uridine(34)/cytosine(34)/5-carboxymethylaminomethyluridine(34)-2'-O)-methyltransferase TrmL [Microaerobacter geothermalis]
MSFHVVLVEPEIPANTGNIARTCAGTNSSLHLVRPLGFSTDDRYLKRAGLDYWDKVEIHYYDSFHEVLRKYPNHRFFFATTKAQRKYTDFSFCAGDFFVFGKETAGLPKEILDANPETSLRIPMISTHIRSLNLSNSVAIMIYEALRQIHFPGMG